MSYSQKYCLVSFINPIDTGVQFNMVNWPLHITLADVFAVDLMSVRLETKLAELLSCQPSSHSVAKEEATLGAAEVVLLRKTKELVKLHMSLVDLLEKNGATFNSPAFTREGFLPHCTIQMTDRIHMAIKYRLVESHLSICFLAKIGNKEK